MAQPFHSNVPLSTESSFLQSHHVPKISENDFNSFLTSKINLNDLSQLKSSFEGLNALQGSQESIGQFRSLSHLIESSFKFQHNMKTRMMQKYALLSDDIFQYRNIKGDGNCFYRAVMFSYIEQLIIFNEIEIVRNIIVDIYNSFQQNDFLKSLKFDSNLIVKILVLIEVAMKKEKIPQAYDIYVKSWNNYKDFDLGLIAYFRFLIYRYTKNNENKLYSVEFPVQVSNLLPGECETEKGTPLYNKFYNEFLFKMSKDAEKIIVYLTSYILCVKVDIVMFECDVDSRKLFFFVGENVSKHYMNIALLNRNNHYQLIYTKEFYRMHCEIFSKYTHMNYKNIVLTEIQESSDLQSSNLFSFEEKKNLFDFNSNPSFISNSNQQIALKPNQQTSFKRCITCGQLPAVTNFGLSVCQNCFFEKLKKQFANVYLSNIKSLFQFFKTCTDIYEYNRVFANMFANAKMKYENNTASLEKNIMLANSILSQSKYKITSTSLQNIVKVKYCIQCQKEVLNNKIILPCNCVICSKECLLNYFNNAQLKKNWKNFGCMCTTIYEPYNILQLIFLFIHLGIQSFRDDAIKLIISFMKEKCAKCQLSFKENRTAPITISCRNGITEKMWSCFGNKVLVFHQLCPKCINDMVNQNDKNFFCFYCRIEHTLVKKEDDSSKFLLW